MASTGNIDITEEDAADLQFPKEWEGVVNSERNFTAPACYICLTVLREPYISCTECFGVKICVTCFANGAEFGTHLSNHAYTLVSRTFALFTDVSWTAVEELKLLDLLLECGFGNWAEIANRIKTHTALDCENHYLSEYVYHPATSELKECMKQSEDIITLAPCPFIPFEYTLSDIPPRYAPNTTGYQALAGYHAPRGDFDTEFDNHAESVISELDFDLFQPGDEDFELGRTLQVAIVEGYNLRLKERVRRKTIIRNHGLINLRKTVSWLKMYEGVLSRSAKECLVGFMKLVTGIEFDSIMESLSFAGNLRRRICELQELRSNGLTWFHSVPMFRELSHMRQSFQRVRKGASRTLWTSVRPGTQQRRQAPPLDIVNLPGYERLTMSERELCAVARIVPESFLEFRSTLTAECRRHNGLRLAQARTLIKIDVNKTRKLYDFLLQDGQITKPEDTGST